MARIARSLAQLRDEVNAAFPNRSKKSDGWLGDPAHASRASRHNPNNAGVVCALDITHDPGKGCDIHAIARRLVQRPHPNLEYVISNGQVAKRSNGFRWAKYSGSNPHAQHAHFAVGRGPESEPTPPYDDTTPWGIAPQEDDDMFSDADRKELNEARADIRSIRAETDKLFHGVTITAIANAVVSLLPETNGGRGLTVEQVEEAVKQALREGVGT